MNFTDFEVLRIGNTVVLSCYVDEPHPGQKMQVTVQAETREIAELHELMLQRLAHCATVYEGIPEDVLKATLQLMKGTVL